jgi:ADP-heptose:LPS heptosyltransferase
MLNPPRRYILNADMLDYLNPYIGEVSDLKGSSKYVPLVAGMPIIGKRILIERNRQRGVGDLLFMTGPMNWIKHICGGNIEIYMYGLSERSMILHGHPALATKTVMAGPLHYDDLDDFCAHWMVDNVTEHNEEREQLNVYDALYRSIGVDPATVDMRFKQPSAVLEDTDTRALDNFYYDTWSKRGIDLRQTGYYVVAPLSHSSLRSAPYGLWLEVIKKLLSKRPVIVVGDASGRVPDTDMLFADFYASIEHLVSNTPTISLINQTSLRMLSSVISRASAVVCLDSGPLYVAEAFRTPAISLWGTHHPSTRLGYDEEYMKNAIFQPELCPSSPCYAYGGFPETKCPEKENQRVCAALRFKSDDVVDRVLKY